MIGMALPIFSAPPATSPTTIVVVDDDDWMIDVASMPMNSPTKGFVVLLIKPSARPFPNILREVPINSRLSRNKYRHKINKKILKRLLYRWEKFLIDFIKTFSIYLYFTFGKGPFMVYNLFKPAELFSSSSVHMI